MGASGRSLVFFVLFFIRTEWRMDRPLSVTPRIRGAWGFRVALRPRRRDGLLRTGTEWEGDDRVKARPRKPSEKDRRDRGPPPEQWKC